MKKAIDVKAKAGLWSLSEIREINTRYLKGNKPSKKNDSSKEKDLEKATSSQNPPPSTGEY